MIAEKTDAAGRHVRQLELCALHCQIVIERERGLEIWEQTNKSERPSVSDSASPARRRFPCHCLGWYGFSNTFGLAGQLRMGAKATSLVVAS